MELWQFGILIASNVSAIAYGYGILHGRVKALEEKSATTYNDQNEIFQRLRALEGITPRLESTAERLDHALSNGLSLRVGRLEIDVAEIKQHCRDAHK